MYTEREELVSYISDAFKDVNGVRPRWGWHTDTIKSLRAWADSLSSEIAAQYVLAEAHSQMVALANHHPRGVVTFIWDLDFESQYPKYASDYDAVILRDFEPTKMACLF